MNLVIKSFEELTKRELYEILRVRSEVFVVEQECVYQDLDGLDYDSIHVSEQTIKNTFSKTKKKFNLGPEVTFHTLRHSFATDYIRKGGDVWKLKSMLPIWMTCVII